MVGHVSTIDSLAPVRAIAARVHYGPWSAQSLVADIGAELISHPGGRSHLGASDTAPDGTGIVVLNDRIIGTPLYVPVLGHELTHVALRDGYRPCLAHYRAGIERRAWIGSAVLAIPAADVAAIAAGEVSYQDVAVECDVPLEFVALRVALESADARDITAAYRRWTDRLMVACEGL